MAISTYKVFLMYAKSGSTYEKLIDIKSFPALGGAPERLETTTLSDRMQTFINGIQTVESMEATANYTLADYKAVKALANKEQKLAFWFGGTENSDGSVTPTGTDGKFAFTGQIDAHVTGGGVNEVVGMTIAITPSTVITEDSAST
jgi:hypothetical protein